MPRWILSVALILGLSSSAAAQALPSPWTSQDIGATGAAGSATFSSGTFTVRGAGADIWGAADAFQFVYQPITGDTDIVARVAGVQNTSTYAKAGIMLRETLTADSRHVILDARPGGEIEFMTRQTAGGNTQFIAGATQSTPWLKLSRSGSSVAASVSADGVAWQSIGSASLSTTGTIYVGLVVTSHVAGTLNTSTFDNVTVSLASPPPPAGNLALNKPARASSQYATQYAPGLAVDGSMTTRWSSVFSDPQWFEVDLQGTYDISEVILRWETAYGADYTVQVSNDDTTWTTIRTVTGGDGGVDDLSGLSGTGRYVRVSGTRRGTQWGYSLWEFEVYGSAAPPPPPPSDVATVVGSLRTYSTIYSIGVEWDITGDTNHNASATAEYRVTGDTAWKSALPLVRVDYNGANMLAGSTLFLQPNTSYDIRLTISDPDGGGGTQTTTIATRPIPAAPASGRTFHVVPGSGGGDGTAANPFKGIAAAQAAVTAGDTVLVHAGNYGGRVLFDRAGAANNYIAWKSAGDGEALFAGIDISGSHVWLEGLTVRDQAYALMSSASPGDVVIERCSFYNNHYSIYLAGAGANWYIADNTIVGDTPYTTESLDGEGIELNWTSGHSVAYNSITNVADAISSPYINVDIFGNDIFDTSDDGIEADGGLANVRMWRNRIHNATHNGISFQPQGGAPWYIIRNQIVGNKEAAFKFRTTDRFVMLHNTIVNWGNAWPGDAMMCCNEDHMMHGISRNNLWVSIQGGQIWGFDNFTKDWRADLDVDGFDWGSAANPFTYGGVVYPDLPSFAAASGLETHGVRMSHSDCFETFNVPNPPPSTVPPQVLTLKAGCNAIDAGAPLPNVDEGAYTGAAPDLGAYEYGVAPPAFGPRAAATTPAPGNVVIYAIDVPASSLHGTWATQASSTSPNGVKIVSADNGAASTAAPLASPSDYVDVTFNADANTPYTLWLRLQALGNSKYNDSLWVQFSDAEVNGSAVYAIGSTSGLLVNLATDSAAGSLNGWGWQNGAYWLSQPVTVTFPTTGVHTVRMQIREDGVQFDQIVLSPSTYLNAAPGGPTNDQTIVPKP